MSIRNEQFYPNQITLVKQNNNVDGISNGSDIILARNDVAANTTAVAFTKVKSIILPGGFPTTNFIVYFTLENVGGLGVSHAQIYINDVAVGTDQSTAGGPTAFTQQINCPVGSSVQIYAYNTLGTSTARVTNFWLTGGIEINGYRVSNP
jgi:hypothetical protein